jgi:hypothetical protein
LKSFLLFLKEFSFQKGFWENLAPKIICLMCGTPSTDGTGFVVLDADLAGSNAAWIPGSWPKPSSAPRHCPGQTLGVIKKFDRVAVFFQKIFYFKSAF